MENKNKPPTALLKYLKPKKVVIFAKSFCTFCTKANQLLSNLNIIPDIIYIDKDPKLKDDNNFIKILEKHSNITTYPKIYIGLNCYGGYSNIYDLFTQNKLFEILKKEKIDFIQEDYY